MWEIHFAEWVKTTNKNDSKQKYRHRQWLSSRSLSCPWITRSGKSHLPLWQPRRRCSGEERRHLAHVRVEQTPTCNRRRELRSWSPCPNAFRWWRLYEWPGARTTQLTTWGNNGLLLKMVKFEGNLSSSKIINNNNNSNSKCCRVALTFEDPPHFCLCRCLPP